MLTGELIPGIPKGVTDHGALTGLADDDHTIYVLVDGTRAMTGNLIATNAQGPAFQNEAVSGSNPTLCPTRADPASGIGGDSGGATVHTIVSGASIIQTYGSVVYYYQPLKPASDSLVSCADNARRWSSVYTGGLAGDYQTSAAASYTADAGDHAIVLTAATAELILPAAATVGRGFELLAAFTGATSRTITPNVGIPDTVAVTAPTQNLLYLLRSDGVSRWSATAIGTYAA